MIEVKYEERVRVNFLWLNFAPEDKHHILVMEYMEARISPGCVSEHPIEKPKPKKIKLTQQEVQDLSFTLQDRDTGVTLTKGKIKMKVPYNRVARLVDVIQERAKQIAQRRVKRC